MNYRQENYANKQKTAKYNEGMSYAQELSEKTSFLDSVDVVLHRFLDVLSEDIESLELLTLGEWETVLDPNGVLDNVMDCCIEQKTVYVPRPILIELGLTLEQIDAIDAEIQQHYRQGVKDYLVKTVRRQLMKLATEMLEITPQTNELLIKKPSKPLV
jgi:hypothetical protein